MTSQGQPSTFKPVEREIKLLGFVQDELIALGLDSFIL